jgi:hypothetical protein
MDMTLIEYLRGLSVNELDELIIDQCVAGRDLAVCKAIIDEKAGSKVYAVPDISTFDGPETQEAQSLPATREHAAINMRFPWDVLYLSALFSERRLRRWRCWLNWKAPRKLSEHG